MPQLNPDPWFIIFIMSWLMFLIILTPHTTKFKLMKKPAMQHTYNKIPSWNWPWF
uniref:ATP synthase complex subunit 8 n=1 Tax=Plethodon shenandoah TaxID=141978 RepID=A0A4Y5P3Q9_9SALA|nr:ATP synthase F0 subunit 8 [Plethodon shenandoah]QCW57891.1 ATP synthase F0 subunit 8 [Plethodon shenandoah]QCW57904.1 ATP synthase F0 subunit 8 [Plethodon shenandoah]QCW57917.1 ATP synthase F0 subunit 8 [Plethodon shenandoah]QCW57930.1 ATP synthase F0 subunit 8 [Plethodon shenandoah]